MKATGDTQVHHSNQFYILKKMPQSLSSPTFQHGLTIPPRINCRGNRITWSNPYRTLHWKQQQRSLNERDALKDLIHLLDAQILSLRNQPFSILGATNIITELRTKLEGYITELSQADLFLDRLTQWYRHEIKIEEEDILKAVEEWDGVVVDGGVEIIE